ncbi:D-alanyl-D-alanine carboxypeptidase [Pikeienuella piscinae]|uniref:serine-type D-Ala-D-Ala carboxypeptidase n=1 Tax=Pikeienuella piscinae TaxID=2748098 RepID=A0A7L5BTP6_9RHOB|nr:D-alanyl-D-alanine carboxypeptidase family protein [Pikeienuella piscinae]QIE54173.1 D-alanyl-D-alanine carboxypeptidase [Pikeienuella piscinae]
MTRFLAALATVLLAAAPASAFDTAARAAMVIDMTSGAVLLEKNPDMPLPPASMSKLMTLDMTFEALQSGRLSLDETFPVSEKAWKMGGSRMFVRAGERVSIRDLLRGVIVQSGNDACVVLAEGLAGSEAAFAEKMNARAAELGMTGSHFVNATGWPDPEHRMTARDLMILVDRMVNVFPEYYPIFAETEFEWDGVKQSNRNPLLYLDLGADGLKTGHTEAAGYGLTGSAIRDGRRIAFVITGLDSMNSRSQEAERLLTWAFREFRTEQIATAGQIVGEAEVWVGEDATVPLTPEHDVIATAPWSDIDKMKTIIRYDGPIAAPIAAGDRIGDLVVEAPGLPPVSTPLIAAAAVAKGGLATRVGAAIRTLLRDEDALLLTE